MRRRRFLAATALIGASALAGCNRALRDGPTTPSAPASVADWTFETAQSDHDQDGVPDTGEPPNVQCLPEDDAVVISGVTGAGDDCDQLVPETISIDEGAFEFAVGVYDGDPPSGCSDILYIRAYEARFEFRHGLPDRVVAVEQSAVGTDDPPRTETACP